LPTHLFNAVPGLVQGEVCHDVPVEVSSGTGLSRQKYRSVHHSLTYVSFLVSMFSRASLILVISLSHSPFTFACPGIPWLQQCRLVPETCSLRRAEIASMTWQSITRYASIAVLFLKSHQSCHSCALASRQAITKKIRNTGQLTARRWRNQVRAVDPLPPSLE
jgi:hypothetical protein